MHRPLRHGGGFVDDGDPAQPRITIEIDGPPLSDGERIFRDFMVREFVADLVTALRGYYDFRRVASPSKKIDAAKLAAMEVPH